MKLYILMDKLIDYYISETQENLHALSARLQRRTCMFV
jgi:hypothetical protein